MTPDRAARTPWAARYTRGLFVFTFLFAGSVCAFAQSSSVERPFNYSKAEVERAVETLRPTASGQLPILEGFVGAVEHSLEQFQRARYQCAVQVFSAITGETVVRVSAKITAWYVDPDQAKSGYQILPSNGRVENDYLDRLEETLGGKSADRSSPAVPPRQKLNLGLSSPIPHASTPAPANAPSEAVKSAEGKGNADPLPSSTPITEEEIAALKSKRQAEEKRVQRLNAAVRNLEEILHNQVSPANLIAVKTPRTPVYATPDAGGKLLFRAEARDEFELIEIRGEWAQVQISGASRGWIRRSQVEMPEDIAAPASPAAGTAPFKVAREEEGPFPGNWTPLQGKTVKVYWVQPAISPTAITTATEKREFAKLLFQKAWGAASPDQQAIAGIVVVFDTPDGGQASATWDTLRQWQDRKISEASFWQRCFLEPREAFQVREKE